MLVFTLISFCSGVSAYLKVVTCFILYLLLKLYLKFSFMLFILTYNNNYYYNHYYYLPFFAVSLMGHMVVSSAC